MRDKPQEALHLISGARNSSRPRRGAAAGGGSRFRAIYIFLGIVGTVIGGHFLAGIVPEIVGIVFDQHFPHRI